MQKSATRHAAASQVLHKVPGAPRAQVTESRPLAGRLKAARPTKNPHCRNSASEAVAATGLAAQCRKRLRGSTFEERAGRGSRRGDGTDRPCGWAVGWGQPPVNFRPLSPRRQRWRRTGMIVMCVTSSQRAQRVRRRLVERVDPHWYGEAAASQKNDVRRLADARHEHIVSTSDACTVIHAGAAGVSSDGSDRRGSDRDG